MSWKKFFTSVDPTGSQNSDFGPISGREFSSKAGPAKTNYNSFLPDVYTGAPNRVERYGQYNTMDMDSEVNAALDILAEFCTQKNKKNDTHFEFKFYKNATNTEVQILSEYLKQWYKLQQFETRMFRILRNTFKYGDAFFLRDPETKKLYHVDPGKINRIIVNESEGKEPEQYIVQDVAFNFKNLIATQPLQTNGSVTGGGTGYLTGGVRGMTGPTNPGQVGSRFQLEQEEVAVDADHMLHISLSEGLDENFPFGNSLLESIFKVYKQKELLEDAIIIYRVQRAPERRVFYVDVGNMPSHLAMQFVERVKTEIHQRRIPSKTGGGTNVIDSSYNPLSINEDYFFPQTAEGRGSKVETLPGGTNLGEIDDLRYFTNKLVRGLRIPSSYLPTGADDSNAQYNDGRVGTAYIQELRFNTYCERLQNLLIDGFDQEFKRYLLEKGVNIDTSMFDIKFCPPQNFAAYRQSELDTARIGSFGQIQAIPFIANRFALKRYLGLSEEEIAENEQLWREENDEELNATDTDAAAEMRGVGISGAGISSDISGAEDIADIENMEDGGEGEAPTSATDPQPAADATAGADAGGVPGPGGATV